MRKCKCGQEIYVKATMCKECRREYDLVHRRRPHGQLNDRNEFVALNKRMKQIISECKSELKNPDLTERRREILEDSIRNAERIMAESEQAGPFD